MNLRVICPRCGKVGKLSRFYIRHELRNGDLKFYFYWRVYHSRMKKGKFKKYLASITCYLGKELPRLIVEK